MKGAVQGAAVFGSLQCERRCSGASILVILDASIRHLSCPIVLFKLLRVVQLNHTSSDNAACEVQLQGSAKDCCQALLQILQHAATAHSSDTWKDATRDAAVWQIQDQVKE